MKELLKVHSALSSQKLHPEPDRHSSSLSSLLLVRDRAPLGLLSWFELMETLLPQSLSCNALATTPSFN